MGVQNAGIRPVQTGTDGKTQPVAQHLGPVSDGVGADGDIFASQRQDDAGKIRDEQDGQHGSEHIHQGVRHQRHQGEENGVDHQIDRQDNGGYQQVQEHAHFGGAGIRSFPGKLPCDVADGYYRDPHKQILQQQLIVQCGQHGKQHNRQKAPVQHQGHIQKTGIDEPSVPDGMEGYLDAPAQEGINNAEQHKLRQGIWNHMGCTPFNRMAFYNRIRPVATDPDKSFQIRCNLFKKFRKPLTFPFLSAILTRSIKYCESIEARCA